MIFCVKKKHFCQKKVDLFYPPFDINSLSNKILYLKLKKIKIVLKNQC